MARSLVHGRGGGGIPQALEIVAYIKHPPRALKQYISLPSSLLGSPGPIGQGGTRRSEAKGNPVVCPPYFMCSVLFAAGQRRRRARGVVIPPLRVSLLVGGRPWLGGIGALSKRGAILPSATGKLPTRSLSPSQHWRESFSDSGRWSPVTVSLWPLKSRGVVSPRGSPRSHRRRPPHCPRHVGGGLPKLLS